MRCVNLQGTLLPWTMSSQSMVQWATQKYNSYICSIQTLLRYLRYMFYVT